MSAIKVYGWQSFRRECPTIGRQTREIVAARSKKEAARLAGYARPSQMFNLCETGNPKEIEVAMSEPGAVFWEPLSYSNVTFTKAEPHHAP